MKKFYLISYSLLLLFFFLVFFFRPITAINIDLGEHILLGRIILQSHSVPHTDIVSYVYPNYPFIASCWLSEVIFYKIVDIAGFNALLLFTAAVVLIACLLQLKLILRKCSSVSIFAVSASYLILLGTRSDVRPEIFSMLFTSFFIFILRTYKKLTLLTGLTLIIIEVLWVNMHIYFIVGPLLVGLFFLHNLITNKKIYIKEVLILAGIMGATLINPNGLRGAIFPLVVLQNYGFPVIENQSLFLLLRNYPMQVLFPTINIVALLIVFILGRRNTKLIDWLLTLVFGALLILNYRNVLLFVFATFVPMVSQVNFIIKRYSKRLLSIFHPPLPLLYPLIALLLTSIIIKLMLMNGFGFGIKDHGKGSVDFVLQNKIGGTLYNDFNIGGYLAYRLYPRLIFLNNRPEAYPASFFKNTYLPMQNDNPAIFAKLDSKYKFNAIIISHRNAGARYSLLHYLMNDPSYSLVYLDSYAFVMVRNSAINREIIEKFKITPDSLNFSNEKDPQELMYYLSFLGQIGWNNKAREVYSQLKKVDSSLCSLGDLPFLRQEKFDFIPESDLKKCKII